MRRDTDCCETDNHFKIIIEKKGELVYLKVPVFGKERVVEEILDAPIRASQVPGGRSVFARFFKEQAYRAQGVAIQVHVRSPHRV